MKIPFGLRTFDNRMVDPAAVENGAKCGCICPECSAPLVAKQGEDKVWHFAHAVGTDCAGGAESAIHRMAKQMIVDREEVFVPERSITRIVEGVFDSETHAPNWGEKLSETVQQAGLVSLSDCEEEKYVQGRRPDLLAKINGLPIAIEIAFTHFCDTEKLAWLETRNLSTLEINVYLDSSIQLPAIITELERRLFKTAAFGDWLVHAGDTKALAKLDEKESWYRKQHRKDDEATTRSNNQREVKQQHKKAFLESIQDIDCQTWKLAISVTLRLAYSRTRCTLKAHGYFAGLDMGIKASIAKVAQRYGGQFNSKYHHYEFPSANPHDLYKALRQDINLNLFLQPQPVPVQPPPQKMPIGLPMPYPGLTKSQREYFEERASILEFDTGLPRDEAERKAIDEVRKMFRLS